MKVLMINSVCGIRSTGRICTDLASELEAQGHEVKIAYGREEVPEQFQKYAIRTGTNMDLAMHVIATRLFDCHGFASKKATKKFLAWASSYNPDMLWLHNIHGYYLNIELLFQWIKSRPNMEVKWTLHDCWSFTGHCTHFTQACCDKWKTQCTCCPEIHCYPASFFSDHSGPNYIRKKELFTGIQNLTLVTPSQWLANLVQQSFLKEYKVEVCYNKINTNIFRPTPSNFREKYDLQNKKIVLGVSSAWGTRKGLSDFLQLSQMLDERYTIVLVGLTEKELSKYSKKLANVAENCSEERNVTEVQGGVVVSPNINTMYQVIVGTQFFKTPNMTANIICIPAINNAYELAEIYTAADVFANPTHEDNYPTVNLEARACGTKVITYDIGGCAETLL